MHHHYTFRLGRVGASRLSIRKRSLRAVNNRSFIAFMSIIIRLKVLVKRGLLISSAPDKRL